MTPIGHAGLDFGEAVADYYRDPHSYQPGGDPTIYEPAGWPLSNPKLFAWQRSSATHTIGCNPLTTTLNAYRCLRYQRRALSQRRS